MFTIELTKNEAHAIASMVSVTAPKDNVAALSMVKMTINEDNSVSLIATNRFTIATQTFMPHHPASLDFDLDPIRDVMLTPTILKALKAAKQTTTLIVDASNVTLFSLGNSATILEIRPKVEMPDLSPYVPDQTTLDTLSPATDPIRLNLDLIAQVSKLRSPEDTSADNPVFDMLTQAKTEFGKPKPIFFKRAALLAIVQPVYSK